MAFKLYFALFFLCCIRCIHIRDICEHVKLDETIQYTGVFSIQICIDHNLTIPLMSTADVNLMSLVDVTFHFGLMIDGHLCHLCTSC